MSKTQTTAPTKADQHWQQKLDLAAALQSAAALDYHEAVANHFSLAVNDSGSRFLINPNQRHFSLIKASDILLIDANDPDTMSRPDAPDPTAWGLHGSIHRHVPQARCVLHVHSIYATVLACLTDSHLPAIDQNSAAFYERHAVAEDFGGMAFQSEGERFAKQLQDPKIKVLVLSNHGIVVIGSTVADAFTRLYYFERAAKTYILALQTGQELQELPHAIANKTAEQWDNYPDHAERYFSDLKTLLDRQGSDYQL